MNKTDYRNCKLLVYNFYASLYIVRLDLGALPRLSDPSVREWFRFGLPAESLISILKFVLAIIQIFTVHG
jgi:hypothetical protein